MQVSKKVKSDETYMKSQLSIFGSVLCLISTFANAQQTNIANPELIELANLAITKLEQTDVNAWAFEASMYENEEGDVSSSLQKHEPTEGKKGSWSLLMINGDKPTKKQQQKFRKDKKKSTHSDQDFGVAIRTILNLPSITLLSETDTHIMMNFDVRLERLGEDSWGKLIGIAHYHKEGAFIERIEISNNDEFSPMFGSSISELTLSLDFIQLNESVLIKQKDLQMKGSFAHFMKIDEVSSDKYSKYVHRDSYISTAQSPNMTN